MNPQSHVNTLIAVNHRCESRLRGECGLNIRHLLKGTSGDIQSVPGQGDKNRKD